MSKFALFAEDDRDLRGPASRAARVPFALAVALWMTVVTFIGYVILVL